MNTHATVEESLDTLQSVLYQREMCDQLLSELLVFE
jgi:hypothetical protein